MHVAYFCLLINLATIKAIHNIRKQKTPRKFDDWRFKDFIKKYDPRTVWERVEGVQKAKGSNYTSDKYIHIMVSAMDEAEDLLKLRIENVASPENPESMDQMIEDARRWRPPPGLNPYPKDRFFIRIRLYELMRQAIYQARNDMVIMQMMREKYRDSSLYKMGFLMSKTDNAVKTFSKFAFRIYKMCGMTRADALSRMYLYDILVTEERLLHLWFNAQLLTDLVVQNDRICSEMLAKHETNRIKKWKFED